MKGIDARWCEGTYNLEKLISPIIKIAIGFHVRDKKTCIFCGMARSLVRRIYITNGDMITYECYLCIWIKEKFLRGYIDSKSLRSQGLILR